MVECWHVPGHVVVVGMKKIMGANHKVNSPKISHIFLDAMGHHWFEPKKAFRST